MSHCARHSDEYRATGERYSTTNFSLLLTLAHLAAGDGARALDEVNAALRFVLETGERIYEPELYRLKGECLRAGAAQQAFEHAAELASERGALLFELRATTSIARIDPTGARARLLRLLERFGADDDCPDVRAAQHLLAS